MHTAKQRPDKPATAEPIFPILLFIFITRNFLYYFIFRLLKNLIRAVSLEISKLSPNRITRLSIYKQMLCGITSG